MYIYVYLIVPVYLVPINNKGVTRDPELKK